MDPPGNIAIDSLLAIHVKYTNLLLLFYIQECTRAISRLDGLLVNSMKLKVQWAKEEEKGESEVKKDDQKNKLVIFVSFLCRVGGGVIVDDYVDHDLKIIKIFKIQEKVIKIFAEADFLRILGYSDHGMDLW